MGRRYIASCALLITITSLFGLRAQQAARGSVAIDGDDIGGTVRSARGPEAGVWVIAETRDLPTALRKIVVTNDAGAYVLPDLPAAKYSIWVRGYGLVDSPRVETRPGTSLDLTAVVAPNARAAAEYYPANYWYSLLQPPEKGEFPGTGLKGNGILETITSQQQYLHMLRTSGCASCHQMGTRLTRELPKTLGPFHSSVEAWDRRVQSGQYGANMSNQVSQFGRRRALTMFADWTDRIAGGELPPAPPRPQGVERNIVITQWEWALPTSFVHSEYVTDKRNPTVNAYGPIAGVEQFSSHNIDLLDPVRHVATQMEIPTIGDKSRLPYSIVQSVQEPSPTWGEELIWSARGDSHGGTWDQKGRLWIAGVVRAPEDQPAFCASHPSARAVPMTRSGRQLAMYDFKTKVFTPIDTCYSINHIQMAEDANQTIWSSGGNESLPWFSTRIWDETHDLAAAQGWLPYVLDTNGNGKLDAYVGPDDPIDPAKDKRIRGGAYAVIPNPIDGTVWTTLNAFPGALIRVDPKSGLSEIYESPVANPKAKDPASAPRGLDVDRNGVIWTGMSGSGHLASFDRRKCKVVNGPTATGQQCLEGWTAYASPGPQFKGVKDSGSTDSHYYTWVDQWDTFGLGKNVPITTGSNSDSLLALLPTGKWVVLRVPYPMGYYSRGTDGRIDDPHAGWKGKGLWATYAAVGNWLMEGGGRDTRGYAMHFQLRTSPTAH